MILIFAFLNFSTFLETCRHFEMLYSIDFGCSVDHSPTESRFLQVSHFLLILYTVFCLIRLHYPYNGILNDLKFILPSIFQKIVKFCIEFINWQGYQWYPFRIINLFHLNCFENPINYIFLLIIKNLIYVKM